MNKLKLNSLNTNKLEKREMELIQGGRYCGCGCCGSSSIDSNRDANFLGGANGLVSIDCEIVAEKWTENVVHD